MNQEKIGKFILELRKEKNMTQQELAEKLFITDRAISKWENGRGMPDLSLFKPLCKELGITINELISGERIDKKKYQEKSEENILNTIIYTDKKIKKNKKIFKSIFIIILLIILSISTMFVIDVNMMRQNKPVVFSLWGFDYTPPVNLKDEEIKLAIKKYLVLKKDNEPKHHDFEKVFVSMRVYLIDEIKKDKLYYVYAWIRDGKYYLENDLLKEDSASSIPYKFIVEKINNEYFVVDYKFPKDGSYFEDMKNIFPRSVRNDMNKVHSDGTVERLKIEVEEQAKLYFHK